MQWIKYNRTRGTQFPISNICRKAFLHLKIPKDAGNAKRGPKGMLQTAFLVIQLAIL